MSRIRTIKPEFWTDDLMGSLKREHRMLFIASWNLADDEGLLRWSAPYLKGAVFPFDDDLSVKDIQAAMKALEDVGVVFAYLGGRSQQQLAYIINFHKHQKINRPSPSKLPPPSLQSTEVRGMYGARDGFVCHLCNGSIDEKPNFENEDFVISIDHVVPVSAGGTDYPSNVKASHQTCNKGRGNRSVSDYKSLLASGSTNAQKVYPDRFTHISLNNSVSDSVSGSNQDRDRDRDREEEKEDSSLRSSTPPTRENDFENRFWSIYPHKVGKRDAEKSWYAALKRGIKPVDLVEGVEAYIRAKPPDRSWCNPATWLNQDRYLDRPAELKVVPVDFEQRRKDAAHAENMRGVL